jgi:hypothetical protein
MPIGTRILVSTTIIIAFWVDGGGLKDAVRDMLYLFFIYEGYIKEHAKIKEKKVETMGASTT